MNRTTLDIIIPCYNPPVNWEKELCNNFLALKKKLKEIEVNLILINDGSSQKLNIDLITKTIPPINYINYNENRGKGYALRKGVEISDAENIIFTDIDFPYELESVVNIFNTLQTNIDVALGHRDANYYKKTPFIRMIISKTFRYLLKLFLNLKATDTQCGLKGFNRKGKEEFLKTTIDRFLFDLEFVKRCSQRKDLNIKAVPVTLKDGVIFSQMNFKILAGEFLNFLMVLIKR